MDILLHSCLLDTRRWFPLPSTHFHFIQLLDQCFAYHLRRPHSRSPCNESQILDGLQVRPLAIAAAARQQHYKEIFRVWCLLVCACPRRIRLDLVSILWIVGWIEESKGQRHRPLLLPHFRTCHWTRTCRNQDFVQIQGSESWRKETELLLPQALVLDSPHSLNDSASLYVSFASLPRTASP